MAGAVAHAAWRGPQPASRLAGLPVAEGGLAPVAAAPSLGPLPPPLAAAPLPAEAPPLLAIHDLVEVTPLGRLPRIGADGRRSVDAYRRQEPAAPGGSPRVAILLVELGLSRAAAEQAVSLPPAIAFAISPYAHDGAGWQVWTRSQGREAILTLPVMPAAASLDDAGPDALSPGGGALQAGLPLSRLLARGRGYPAVALPAGAFAAAPARFEPLAAALAARGLGLIELGDRALAPVAARAGLAYLAAAGPIDGDGGGPGIERALAAIESQALAQGRAIGYGRAIPITIERLAAWANSLPRKGIRLVGPGDLLQP
jgi:polysaccharide deacetylase 2 family uncharacterized protein YibQ